MLLAGLLSGCAGKPEQHLEGSIEAPLELPEGMQSRQLKEVFAIPEGVDVFLPNDLSAPRPASLGLRSEQGAVRLQRIEDDSWLLVELVPSRVWPLLLNFLTENSILVQNSNATQGMVTTEWNRRPGSPARERFRFSLERGLRENTTQLMVSHQYEKQDEGAGSASGALSNSSRKEDMLRRLAQYTADNLDQAASSFMAQVMNLEKKMYLRREADGQYHLELKLPIRRAWGSLRKAIATLELEVLDEDFDEGTYTVAFPPGVPKRSTGYYVLRVTAGGQGVKIHAYPLGEDQEEAARNLILQIRDHLS